MQTKDQFNLVPRGWQLPVTSSELIEYSQRWHFGCKLCLNLLIAAEGKNQGCLELNLGGDSAGINMANEHLTTYLNDHMAGSIVALELLDHLEVTHSENERAIFFRQLRADIAADRDELQNLMERLDIAESRTRKASAWLAEKMTELKLRFDDPEDGALRLFESLEALSLGIEGKRSLWIALMAAAEESSSLRILDYERLTQRAQEQRDQVETQRIEAAKKALSFD
ncbi:MAG TPA: hypothetical protein VGO56_09395 [Pyrinomonadaceae bacterium]|jgi:hypothetical protein|nr:hypothetical protein [Pyrinomonadaceae bacterium]